MTSLGLKAISATFTDLTNLVELNISYNKIEKEGCLPFAEKLFHLENLRELYFEKNRIEDGIYIVLSNLYIVKNLQIVLIDSL